MPYTSFPISYAAILLELVTEHGGNAADLLRGTGLDEAALVNIESRLSARQLQALIENAVRTTREPALGLLYGQRLTLTSHGVLGYALMSCKSMQQVVEILMKYYRLLLDAATLHVTQQADFISIRYRVEEHALSNRTVNREIFFSGLLTAIRQLLHRESIGAKLKFTFPRPDYVNVYYNILGPDIEFGAAEDQLSLPVEILNEKPEFANPAMLKIYQQQCDALLAQAGSSEGLRTQVWRYLLASGSPFPLLDQTAAHFNMSSRTFRRRLASENTSFQAILDSLRRELAETYLRNHALTVENVAELLGFNDSSNFRRAFIHWTGMSPSAYQKSQMPQTQDGDSDSSYFPSHS